MLQREHGIGGVEGQDELWLFRSHQAVAQRKGELNGRLMLLRDISLEDRHVAAAVYSKRIPDTATFKELGLSCLWRVITAGQVWS